MSKMGEIAFEIEEAIIELVANNKFINDEVMGNIADKLKVPVDWVEDAYEKVIRENYGDW